MKSPSFWETASWSSVSSLEDVFGAMDAVSLWEELSVLETSVINISVNTVLGLVVGFIITIVDGIWGIFVVVNVDVADVNVFEVVSDFNISVSVAFSVVVVDLEIECLVAALVETCVVEIPLDVEDLLVVINAFHT